MSIVGAPNDAGTARVELAVRQGRRGQAALLLLLLVALVMWGLSLSSVDVTHLDDYGLPPALPITWYFALAAIVVGASLAITAREPNGLLISAFVLGLAVALYATVPFVSDQPHYGWVYKHIGVTKYIEANGRVDGAIDIYHRWPGMFALSALLGSVGARLDPTSYAQWAELFFACLDAALVGAIGRVVTRSTAVAGGAALLFLLGNWVGQMYYSPQALGFALSLGFILTMLVGARFAPGPIGRAVVTLGGRMVRRPDQLHGVALPPRWPVGAIVAITTLFDLAIIASHQLTPYVIVFQLGLLIVAGLVAPRWLVIIALILPILYLLPNLHFVDSNFGLFSKFDPLSNAQHSKVYDISPEPGKLFNARMGQYLTFFFWIATAISTIRLARLRLGAEALPLLLLVVAPFAIVFGQSYGGEATLRIILFSSPFCAVLIAWAISTVTRVRLRAVAFAGVALVMAGLFVPTYFGQEEINIMPKGVVDASEYFYEHAEGGAVLLQAGPNFPGRSGSRYPLFAGPTSDFDPNLFRTNTFRYRPLGARDVPEIIDLMRQYARQGYVVFSKPQSEYSDVFRLTPPGALRSLEDAVRASPRFRLWYANSDARIYQLEAVPARQQR